MLYTRVPFSPTSGSTATTYQGGTGPSTEPGPGRCLCGLSCLPWLSELPGWAPHCLDTGGSLAQTQEMGLPPGFSGGSLGVGRQEVQKMSRSGNPGLLGFSTHSALALG